MKDNFCLFVDLCFLKFRFVSWPVWEVWIERKVVHHCSRLLLLNVTLFCCTLVISGNEWQEKLCPWVWTLISISLLICTLISENLGLEKFMSVSNPRKISASTQLDFFQVYIINPTYFRGRLEKALSLQNLKFF